MPESDYRQGYEAAYAEIHGAIVSQEHPRICGGSCRACGVMRAQIESLLHDLAGMMTEEEFATLTSIIANVNTRLES